MSCEIHVEGVSHTAYNRCALRVFIDALREAKNVNLWSGGHVVAPPDDRWETTMDREDFRECEAEVVCAYGQDAFALETELCSDSCVISLSGGASSHPTFCILLILILSRAVPCLVPPSDQQLTGYLEDAVHFLLSRLRAFGVLLTFPMTAHKLYPVRMRVVGVVGPPAPFHE